MKLSPQLYYFCIQEEDNQKGFEKLYEKFSAGLFKNKYCKKFYSEHYRTIINNYGKFKGKSTSGQGAAR